MVTPGGQRAGGRVLARRYHLQRVLGRGAMGAVWEAEDTFLRRTVAVKEVVLPGSLSPEERAVSCERTLREARAIARLGHPNVVTLFDVLDEDARPWVVMELVPSRSLAEVIKEDGPLHPLRVATVGLAILGALEAAHAAHITHRDVKPGNILLGHDGRVKLTDFGIARAAGDDTITGTGLLVGSPSYIAPEIVKGQEAGAPADLWGLGATLYAAVEGRAPFSGGDAMETLAKVVQEPPTPYVRAGALVPALNAMLEKDPVKRARPVDARRALLDVLRGGNETEAPGPRGGSSRSAPSAAPSPAASAASSGSSAASAAPVASEAPESEPAAAPSGPALADLLVPVWRQGGDDAGSPMGTATGPAARDAGRRSAPAAPAAAGRTTRQRDPDDADQPGTSLPDATDRARTADELSADELSADRSGVADPLGTGDQPAADADEVVADAPAEEAPPEFAAADEAPAADAPTRVASAAAAPAADPTAAGTSAGRTSGGASAGRTSGGASAGQTSGGASAGRTSGGASAGRTSGGASAGRTSGGAPAAADDVDAPASVAGSTVSGRAREVLAADADLVGPEVADPDLVELDRDADTRTDLGLASGPAAAALPGDDREGTATAAPMPAEMHDEAADEVADVEPVETDSEATVTLPAGTPTGPVGPSGAPGKPARTPAYGGYGGATEAELRTQRIAPLPFGAAAGTVAEQQPARAFRPQPPASPLDFQDERPRGDRRKRGLAALLVVAALALVVLAGGFLLVKGLRGDGSDSRATGTPSPSASLGRAVIPTGFTRYVGSGFTVGVPNTWPPRSGRDGVVDARDPDSTRFLRLITVDSTTSALDQLGAAEKQFAANPSYGAYQRVRLQKVDYRGLDAADWEFTFTLDGVARHVLYRGIVTEGRTYGLYLSTPADRWAASTNVFQVAANTFRTS